MSEQDIKDRSADIVRDFFDMEDKSSKSYKYIGKQETPTGEDVELMLKIRLPRGESRAQLVVKAKYISSKHRKKEVRNLFFKETFGGSEVVVSYKGKVWTDVEEGIQYNVNKMLQEVLREVAVDVNKANRVRRNIENYLEENETKYG